MSDKKIAVRVKNVLKTFKLPHEQHSGIKQVAINVLNKNRGFEKQKVLNDISFEIEEGEFFGIVGRNGSGKSTLLKLLAGIYAPDKGLVQVNGSLTPFIELGVGFNPELTGRENVFLNGALLGFSRDDMSDMYEEIVSFAEIEKFMDQKLKNYSSGMQVRLAFSIAIRARSDILLIDEVLAVGDAAFQQKCFDYFELLKKEKRTIIFVSHDMASVKKFCNRALYITKGKITAIGTPQKIAAIYDKENDEKVAEEAHSKNKKNMQKSDLKITLTDEKGSDQTSYDHNQVIRIGLEWSPKQFDNSVENVGIAIFRDEKCVYGINTLENNLIFEHNKASLFIKANLGRGRYKVVAGLFGSDAQEAIIFNPYGPEFFINQQTAISGESEWEGITKLESSWRAG